MLEEEIKRLTKAVETLTKALLETSPAPFPVTSFEEQPEPQQDDSTAITASDLTKLAQSLIRKGKTDHTQVKTFIHEAGADKITNLTEEGRIQVQGKLNDLG